MLTAKAGYEMVYRFLEDVYIQHKDEYKHDFPILLSDMSILTDGTTADPAQWHDWKALFPDGQITSELIFATMLTFLEAYRQRGDTGEIAHLFHSLTYSEFQNHWDNQVQHFISETME